MVTGEDTNLPEAEPFPATAASAPGGTTTPLALEEAVQLPTDGTGPAPHQKQRAHKALQMDTTTELRQNEISQWNRNYISNMACVAKLRKNHKISGQAKKNASFWVFGTGIGKIGKGIGKSKLPGPLDMFSGEALMLVLHMSSPESGPRKRKSPSDEGTSSEAEDRRVRPRDDNQDQIGRGNDVAQVDDDDLMVSIEEGVSSITFLSTLTDSRSGYRAGETSGGRTPRYIFCYAMEYQCILTGLSSGLIYQSWSFFSTRWLVIKCSETAFAA